MSVPQLTAQLHAALRDDAFWSRQIEPLIGARPGTVALHLAVFVEPYLQRVLDGLKTVESRFASDRRAPYRQADAGDIIVLKRSGGPIVGIAQISDVRFYELTPAVLGAIREQFETDLGVSDQLFWEQRAHAAFATLMWIGHVRAVVPVSYRKRDRRGWVILIPRR
jgi:ASC-1-like (ASCH) protein